MKLAIALILALQVAVCVQAQDWPQPDRELVEKYEVLKACVFKRVSNAWEKVKVALESASESSPAGRVVKEYVDELLKRPRVESAIKIAGGLASELSPVVHKARTSLLGVYGHYLRPYIGKSLDKAINNIRPVLDTVMPQEG